jgi:hypothetical protein
VVEPVDDPVVGVGAQVAVDVGGALHGAVAEPAADLEQVGTDGDPWWDGGVAEIVESQRGVPGGASGGEPGTLVPVGGVQAPAPRGAENQGVCFAGAPVAASVE